MLGRESSAPFHLSSPPQHPNSQRCHSIPGSISPASLASQATIPSTAGTLTRRATSSTWGAILASICRVISALVPALQIRNGTSNLREMVAQWSLTRGWRSPVVYTTSQNLRTPPPCHHPCTMQTICLATLPSMRLPETPSRDLRPSLPPVFRLRCLRPPSVSQILHSKMIPQPLTLCGQHGPTTHSPRVLCPPLPLPIPSLLPTSSQTTRTAWGLIHTRWDLRPPTCPLTSPLKKPTDVEVSIPPPILRNQCSTDI